MVVPSIRCCSAYYWRLVLREVDMTDAPLTLAVIVRQALVLPYGFTVSGLPVAGARPWVTAPLILS